MYEVDDKDRVETLQNVPQSSVGAPMPIVLADEQRVVLAYCAQEATPARDGSKVRSVDPSSSDLPIAIVRFNGCWAHMFGPPNDEAFEGHPLASRGLAPYGAFRIEHSSWIRGLERMNSVHVHHRAETFRRLRHLVFVFHDSTFECVCREFDSRLTRGSIASIVPELARLLESNSG